MKKFIFSALLALAATFSSPGNNLIKNSSFDSENLYEDMSFYANRGKFKVEVFTEDRTWNKCARMEITQYKVMDGANHYQGAFRFGRNGKMSGFQVEPDTVYDFAFDIKGSLSVSLMVYFSDKPINTKYPGKAIRVTPRTAAGNEKEWTRVKGSFKTAANSKFAILAVQCWGNGKQQAKISPIGGYFMLDNVTVSKRKQLLDSDAPTAAVEAVKPRTALTVPFEKTLKFSCKNPSYKPIDVPVRVTGNQDAVTIAVELPPADKSIVPATENGNYPGSRDDALDVFFAPVKNDRPYSQFAIGSGGGRFHSTGVFQKNFDQWAGKAELKDGKRLLSVTVPWKMLGFDRKPEAGSVLPMNIGIRLNRQSYSFSPVKVGFNDVTHFGNIIFGSIDDYKKQVTASISADRLEKFSKEIKAFRSNKENDPGKVIACFQTLQNKMDFAAMGKTPYLVANLPLAGSLSAPLEISAEQIIKKPIKLQGARNEKLHLPLAIVNRTDQAAAYRIIVHADNSQLYKPEVYGLSNNFPAENIICREILPVKDSDSDKPEIIYDPMPKMNEAQTITLPARSTGAIWLEFDCNNVPEGSYNGFIRIIPLSEPAKFFSKTKAQTAIKDYPLTVTVLPITLPPPIDLAMFQRPVNQDYFNKSCEIGNPRLMLSGYTFRFQYDNQGNIVNSQAPLADAAIAQIKECFKNGPPWVRTRVIIGYSFYDTFKKNFMPKNIKPLTPEWEKCWANHVKAIMDICRKHNLDKEQLYAELVDEPKKEFFNEYLAAAKIASKTEPALRLMITWGAAGRFGIGSKMAAEFSPYMNEQMYWWGLRKSPDFMNQRDEFLKQPGTTSALYECSTGMRENLYTYFRMHPWRTRCGGFDAMGFYCWSNNMFNAYSGRDWRCAQYGGITYNANGKCIPSVRMYALIAGSTDMRYYDALKALKNRPDAQKFLKEATGKIMRQSHNPELADWFRSEAVRILLKK